MDNLLHLVALCFIPLLFGLVAHGIMDIFSILRKPQAAGREKPTPNYFWMFFLAGQKPSIHN